MEPGDDSFGRVPGYPGTKHSRNCTTGTTRDASVSMLTFFESK